jgi:hypothetical protein
MQGKEMPAISIPSAMSATKVFLWKKSVLGKYSGGMSRNMAILD